MAKDPWFKFYPTDWLSDSKLQSCSLGARGLLIEVMCLMHQSRRPGYLLINGHKPPINTLKTLVKTHHKTLITHLKELLDNGVLKEEDGVLVCPRMVRDQAYRESQSNHGKRGGNPKLVDQTHKGSLKPRSQKLEARDKETTTTTTTNMCVLAPDDGLLEKAKEVIVYLNESTGSRFRPTGKNVDLVRTRLKEGFTVEDCKQVVDGQKLDPYFLEHPKYFRPSTLFGSKFEGYLSAAPKNRAALERDPKKLIDEMRYEAAIRRFVEGDNATNGQGRLCKRNDTDGLGVGHEDDRGPTKRVLGGVRAVFAGGGGRGVAGSGED